MLNSKLNSEKKNTKANLEMNTTVKDNEHKRWADPELRPELIKVFKSELETYRKQYLEVRQRKLFQNSGKVVGINWKGICLFQKLTGLENCTESMPWIIKNVVKPICEEKACQLAELFMGVSYESEHCLGVANWFHSYTWQEPFKDTVLSVGTNLYRDNSKSKNYFWW